MAGEMETVPAPADSVTVADETLTASTDWTALAQDYTRERFVVSVGVADVWLGFDTAAVVGKGVVVRAAGDPYIDTTFKGELHMISSGAATVGIAEYHYFTGDDEGELPSGGSTFTPSGPSDDYYSECITAWTDNDVQPGVPYPSYS